ncbi:MAG: COX15/CtaA family protein [Hyphomicrobiaceae bacterium]
MTESKTSQVTHSATQPHEAGRLVELWLVVIAIMVLLTAVIGAATRLTGSGLSITEWKPILGVIPPLDDATWHAEFARYKQIPQYIELNKGMSLADFKSIYWWEWTHRLVARSIGVVFAVPLILLWLTRQIPRWLLPRLLLILALGGLQGAIGWIMVMSGLAERTSVSPYRLTLHLGCAVLIFALTVWTALDLRTRRRPQTLNLRTLTAFQSASAWILVPLVYIQILLGALVAGHKAGLTYNTWPLMDGHFVPKGLWTMQPWWMNVLENITTVQFDHRMVAYVIVLWAIWQGVSVARTADDARVRHSGIWLALATFAQMSLGIWTLLAWVPVPLGVVHQAGAFIVLTLALWHLHAVRTAKRAIGRQPA